MRASITVLLFSIVFAANAQHQSNFVSSSNELALAVTDRPVVIHRHASYPGGMNAFYQHLKNELTYPEAVRRQCKEGSVVVSFRINEEGLLQDFKIVQSLGEPFDNEALRVLKNMPKWTPGIRNGIPVVQKWTQPIKFTFDN